MQCDCSWADVTRVAYAAFDLRSGRIFPNGNFEETRTALDRDERSRRRLRIVVHQLPNLRAPDRQYAECRILDRVEIRHDVAEAIDGQNFTRPCIWVRPARLGERRAHVIRDEFSHTRWRDPRPLRVPPLERRCLVRETSGLPDGESSARSR